MQDEFLVHTREGEPCLRCGARSAGSWSPAARPTSARAASGGCGAAPAAARREGARHERAESRRRTGFLIGHWTDAEGATGCTVVIAPPGSRGGVDVRGGGPGTRETDVIGPLAGRGEVTAVVLSGGSAYGLAAADGAMRWLEERGRGLRDAGRAGADRPGGGRSTTWPPATRGARPGPDAGYAACEAAARGFRSAGASAPGPARRSARSSGASARRRPGSGYAAARHGLGQTVAALAVVNAFGDVIGEDGEVLAGPRDDGETPVDGGD